MQRRLFMLLALVLATEFITFPSTVTGAELRDRVEHPIVTEGYNCYMHMFLMSSRPLEVEGSEPPKHFRRLLLRGGDCVMGLQAVRGDDVISLVGRVYTDHLGNPILVNDAHREGAYVQLEIEGAFHPGDHKTVADSFRTIPIIGLSIFQTDETLPFKCIHQDVHHFLMPLAALRVSESVPTCLLLDYTQAASDSGVSAAPLKDAQIAAPIAFQTKQGAGGQFVIYDLEIRNVLLNQGFAIYTACPKQPGLFIHRAAVEMTLISFHSDGRTMSTRLRPVDVKNCVQGGVQFAIGSAELPPRLISHHDLKTFRLEFGVDIITKHPTPLELGLVKEEEVDRNAELLADLDATEDLTEKKNLFEFQGEGFEDAEAKDRIMITTSDGIRDTPACQTMKKWLAGPAAFLTGTMAVDELAHVKEWKPTFIFNSVVALGSNIYSANMIFKRHCTKRLKHLALVSIGGTVILICAYAIGKNTYLDQARDSGLAGTHEIASTGNEQNDAFDSTQESFGEGAASMANMLAVVWQSGDAGE